ncbi:MAG: bifunctional riboflavin kinase/FAD synthetase [Bacteroidales bacterium]|nr:bifunctional riboflavin kinase/FAD synthetase [Bacteroidales bacterium]
MEVIRFEEIRKFDQQPILSIGMFDGVHKGHQALLKELVQEAEREKTCSMVISFDKHPRQVVSDNENEVKILQTDSERIEKLSDSGVDYLVILHFTKEIAKLEASEFLDLVIENINPKALLLGYDNRFGRKGSTQFDDILAKGEYKNIKIRRTQDCVWYNDIEISSTQIRKALEKGEVNLANQMLGYAYTIEGKVINGYKIGRTLGFPTANIQLTNNKLLPQDGVYAVECQIDDKTYKGVLSIGERATFNIEGKSIELHIFFFERNIYNKEIKIEFKEFLRKQEKFPSVDALVEQIKKDCENAKNILSNY